ncbi:MAG: hypothetical protein QM796_09750 [Chthoniobacteraceae bacterium]
MRFLNSLEAKFGHLAIPGLIRIVVFLQALVFVLHLINPHFLELLYLDPKLVMEGQIWRLVTYIFIPSVGRWWLMPDYLWLVFALLFLWMLGDGLEYAWGSFRLNLFYLIGMVGTTIAAFFFGSGYANILLNTSLLFAFATIFPNHLIRMYFVFSVRIKWLAWGTLALLLLTFLSGGVEVRMSILVQFVNYFLFFWRFVFQMARDHHYISKRQAEFHRKVQPDGEPMHVCEVCKRSDQTNPELDFRVSADGHTYCQEHLPAKSAVAG